jgi:hypothetical protein
MTFKKQTSWLSGKQVRPSRLALASLATALAVILSACSSPVNIPKATASGPQQYMTPTIYEGASAVEYTSSPAVISIDDAALTFAQKTYSAQSAAQINYSGNLASPVLARGLEELEITYASGTTYSAPQLGSGWAVELAGQSGGLEQLTGHRFVPMVPAITCPSMSSAETFLFVTLPEPLGDWNPALETAYGSVDISASGSNVTFASIKQNTLSRGTQANASSSSVTGACSSTVYGNTVAVPANPTITVDPTGTVTITPQAMLGIGPSGLLVEDSGGNSYLGAGTGAIGLPKPASAVDTGSLVGAQYLGFFYGSGSSGSTTSGSSSVASFGFPTPTTCVAPQTSTMLYGGDFTDNNPAAPTVQQKNGGFGTCDFAIDLGAQTTNGLFPNAMVYVGAGFATNTAGITGCGLTTGYCFSAVAIAGQLNGKFAIFLIGEDTVGSPNQAWGIYLLQSN